MNPFLPSGGGDMAATKPLVLCADDYAQSATISAAIRRLAAQGRLSATSAMVLSPHWPEEAAALRANGRGRIDVGLHLDWTSPFAIHAGHGMTLNRAMARAALGGFDRTQATAVIDRQLDAFEAAWGAPPDHVDGHQHVQQFAGIREALVACLARRYGALARRLKRAAIFAALQARYSRQVPLSTCATELLAGKVAAPASARSSG